MLEFVVIVMLAMAFAQTFPIDLAILFAGDTLMYLEILPALRLAAGRGALKTIWPSASDEGPAVAWGRPVDRLNCAAVTRSGQISGARRIPLRRSNENAGLTQS
jgi:hypothetical protein